MLFLETQHGGFCESAENAVDFQSGFHSLIEMPLHPADAAAGGAVHHIEPRLGIGAFGLWRGLDYRRCKFSVIRQAEAANVTPVDTDVTNADGSALVALDDGDNAARHANHNPDVFRTAGVVGNGKILSVVPIVEDDISRLIHVIFQARENLAFGEQAEFLACRVIAATVGNGVFRRYLCDVWNTRVI